MHSLKEFIKLLEKQGDLKRVTTPVSSYLEITEIHKRTLEADGPALLFENVTNKEGQPLSIPVLVNLFGSRRRILAALKQTEEGYAKLAQDLALLRAPQRAPSSFKDALGYLPLLRKVLNMKPKVVANGPARDTVHRGADINLYDLPIQWCWPNEPAPLITWGAVITKPSKGDKKAEAEDYNLGIYRLQVHSKDKLIVRWLKHRGGAQHFEKWKQKYPGEDMPMAIAIGASPAVTLSAVMPLPENMSEFKFAGLLSGKKTELMKGVSVDLLVPAQAEIIIEGYVSATETALEGPYGDHTGYYNAEEHFPLLKVTAITMAKKPVYLSTYTGRPMDEPAMLSLTLNDLYTPILKATVPEIEDFYLVPEACSYRTAIVSIKKSYPGQARKVAMSIWSALNQFMYTKLIIVIDHDLSPRNNSDVQWALSTNIDPIRDVSIIRNTPMDYLDFASEEEHLASKMMIDATTKIPPETKRGWGKKLVMSQEVIDLVDKKWKKLNI